MSTSTSNSIVVSNLPQNTSTYELAFQFGEVGLIKRNYLEKNGAKQFTGTAHITYFDSAHAAEATQKFNETEFKSRKIGVALAEPRPLNGVEDSGGPKPGLKRKLPTTEDVKSPGPALKKKKSKNQPDVEVTSKSDEQKSPRTHKKKLKKKLQEKSEVVQQKPKVEKCYNKDQPGRLVVRNISFKATENDVTALFKAHGNLVQVNLLKHHNPKLPHKGLGFVQFTSHEEAVKAIRECNCYKLKDRHIAVDHAVPKARFQQPKVEAKTEVKEESNDTEIFAVPVDVASLRRPKKDAADLSLVKQEEESLCGDSSDHFTNFWPANNVKGNSRVDNNDCSVVDEKPCIKSDKPEEEPRRVPIKPVSRDVEERRSVFVSKLSLDTTALGLETAFAKFGAVKRALLVTDKLTEQPRGCAFVQFKNAEGVESCLEAAEDPSRRSELTVDGRIVTVRISLPRDALNSSNNKKDEPKGKDNRNLYLAREGFIREGTAAAKGVSAADIQLRRTREQVKERLLSNLHMFVSPLRLVVHNLPLELNDFQLKQTFLKHAPPKAKVVESRVMRDLKTIEEGGFAKSRGYGFVAFTRHSDALVALRSINNNPEVFSANRRPIVEFSIENLNVLKSKLQRAEKSKLQRAEKSKLQRAEKSKLQRAEKSTAAKTGKKLSTGKNTALVKTIATPPATTGPRQSFCGLASSKLSVKPGKKLHVHLGPKFRHRDQTRGGRKTPNKPGKPFRGRKNNRNRKPSSNASKAPNKKQTARAK